ncbi:MAG: hypothetical protein JSW60_04310 [Thermoplasmatales archaeon]|nr:MAG: hypothetical protein JSW60_04310 [Thermoplasmatales archaeon]
MKKIIVVICVIGLMLMALGLSVNAFDKDELSRGLETRGNTLITEFGGNQTFGRVIEVDSDGNEVWNKSGLSMPQDAERLSNGITLVTEYAYNRVIEVNSDGHIIWQKTGLNQPVDAERLYNVSYGHTTLITEFGAQRVIEVDTDGNIVWQKNGLNSPFDAERLSNGNTLIAEAELYPDGRVIEIDSAGNEVWNITGLDGPVDVERLHYVSYGNTTLITEHVGMRVIEVNSDGNIIWQKTGLLVPKDAERLLDSNNTLIAECGANRVIEVNSDGNNEWLKSGLRYPVDAERLSLPPSVEIINPKEGYFHLSGIPLLPTYINLIADTLSLGGFRLRPIIINATDDIDNSENLTVSIYLNGEYQGNAIYCCDWRLHEWFWTGWALGTYNLTITAKDSDGGLDSAEIEIWNFCFIP